MSLPNRRTYERLMPRLIAGLVAVGMLSLALSACGATGSASPVSNADTAATSVHPGWKTYVYEQAAISVPADWHVMTSFVCPEPKGPGTLFLGPSEQPRDLCTQYSENVDSVSVMASPLERPFDAGNRICPSIRVNGLVVDVGPCSSSNLQGLTSWLIPALGIVAHASQRGGASVGAATTTVVGRVLHSLRRATAKEVMASSPVDWPTYTYQSAAISVPKSWTVRRNQNCPDTSAEGTLELGIPKVFSGCTLIEGTPAEVTLSHLTSGVVYASCPSIEVNGLRTYLANCETRQVGGAPEAAMTWAIPSLGIEVQGAGSGSAQSAALVNLIFHTIRRTSAAMTVAPEPAVTRPWPTGCRHGQVSVTVQRVESFLCVEVGSNVTISFEKPKTAGPWVPLESGLTAGSAMAPSWTDTGALMIDHATAVAPGYSAAFSSYYRHLPERCQHVCQAPASVRIRVSFNVVPAKHLSGP
jgi:hypothetical protein